MEEIKFIYTCVRDNGYTFSSKPFTLEDIEDGYAKTWYAVNAVSGKVYKRRYAGLKDKNSREIYDGDILKASVRKENYIVVWANCGFFLQSPDTGKIRLGLWLHHKKQEVIGNIYEHKHLLV